jgi:hypothetical protein
MPVTNDHHIYFARRMKEKRNEQRRQHNLPIQGEDQRHGHERRSDPETQPPPGQQTSQQQQQQWTGQYTEKNPFSELLYTCGDMMHSQGLRVDVMIIRLHPIKH